MLALPLGEPAFGGFSPDENASAYSNERWSFVTVDQLVDEALAAARARLESEAGRQLYAQRQGVESTLSQGVRAFGLRQARYRGLAKTGLQNVATAAALNLDRLTAWLAQRPLAPTRISRFAALTA